ncbi:MAG TPA: phage tail protein [Thermomicrobiales bacterium]|nr:phage tail protein [Thermomicrobiales bacterium]
MADIKYPLVGYHFFIEIQGKLTGMFKEVSGLSTESEKIEYKASGPKGEEITIYQPGRPKATDVVLKRGLTDSMEMWDWRKEIDDGKFKDVKKNGSIVMYDQAHTEVARWNFENAWPTKIEGPGLNAGNNEIAMESLTLSVTKLTRVK